MSILFIIAIIALVLSAIGVIGVIGVCALIGIVLAECAFAVEVAIVDMGRCQRVQAEMSMDWPQCHN